MVEMSKQYEKMEEEYALKLEKLESILEEHKGMEDFIEEKVQELESLKYLSYVLTIEKRSKIETTG